MKKFLVGLITTVGLVSSFVPAKTAEEGPWQDPKRFVIENDGGGNVVDFRIALAYFTTNRLAFSVSGYCASACTLILSKDYNLDVCVKKNVRFGIHKPFVVDILGTVQNKIPNIYRTEMMWREEFFNKYPEWLKTAIERRGDVPAAIQGDQPSDIMWITYEDVKPFIKTCIPKQGAKNE